MGRGQGRGGEGPNLLVPLIPITFLAGKVSLSRPNERTVCVEVVHTCVCYVGIMYSMWISAVVRWCGYTEC